jgi:hypothetical protein
VQGRVLSIPRRRLDVGGAGTAHDRIRYAWWRHRDRHDSNGSVFTSSSSATLSVATKSFRSCRRQADISGGQERDRRSNRRRRRGAARNSGRRCPRSGSSLAIAAGYEPLPRFAIEAWRGERSPQELLRDTLYRRMQALDRPAHRRERESPRLPHALYRPSWRSRAEKPRSPWHRLIEY